MKSVIGLGASLERKTLLDFFGESFETYTFHARTSDSIASKTLCNRRMCNGEYLNSDIVYGGN